MNMKLVAALTAALSVGTVCSFAANPFVDVPADSWAYKSVVELADAGIIQGVDGQYFQGSRNITRYEAAELVAKAMAHQDKATVEQRALINKLADEYADELNNLGVRVSALEGKVGNVVLSGDARVRFQNQKNSVENDASWSGRVRLRADAKVNDSTDVHYGLVQDLPFDDSNSASGGDNLYTDRAEVVKTFGNNVKASVGRTDAYVLGNGYGYNYGDIFDRAELKYTNDSVALTAGYGKFKAGGNTDLKTGYGEIEGFFGNGSAVGVYYNGFNNADGTVGKTATNLDNLWGAYASLNLTDKVNLLANYETVSYNAPVNGNDDSANVWVGQLKYGNADMASPKSWDLWVEYINAEKGAFINGSTNSWRFASAEDLDNITSWGAGFDYTLAKNTKFSFMQSFATDRKDNNGTDPEEQTRAELNFAF